MCHHCLAGFNICLFVCLFYFAIVFWDRVSITALGPAARQLRVQREATALAKLRPFYLRQLRKRRSHILWGFFLHSSASSDGLWAGSGCPSQLYQSVFINCYTKYFLFQCPPILIYIPHWRDASRASMWCTTRVSGICGGQKRALDLLELDIVVSHHMDVGNWVWEAASAPALFLT